MTTTIVLATANLKKLAELSAMLLQAGVNGIKFVTLAEVDPENKIPEPDETGETFAENALLKARYYAGALNLPCLAEDSGLLVTLLPDVAGVYSKRWFPGTDADRNVEVIRRLKSSNFSDAEFWTGAYICALCYVDGDGDVLYAAQGDCVVRIVEPRGSGGFGYDPITAPEEGDGRTFGEMEDPMEKARYSHRSKALRAFVDTLPRMQLAD